MTVADDRGGVELPAGRNIILCADDFAITDGVSRGIEDLAAGRRLSATSAIVNLERWGRDAERLARLRPSIAIGLHVNLTLGAPLGPMPKLAPLGRFPGIAEISRRALLRSLDAAEIAAEVGRQLAAFEAGTGFAPDFIDGHQHAHSLPVVREGVIAALVARFPTGGPLVRDPADTAGRIFRRGACVGKSLTISWLAAGFGDAVRRAGFVTNDGFSGVSPFAVGAPFGEELQRFFAVPGRRHLVMCHPGFPDAELAAIDEVSERRREELAALHDAPGLPDAIWHVARGGASEAVRWPMAAEGTIE